MRDENDMFLQANEERDGCDDDKRECDKYLEGRETRSTRPLINLNLLVSVRQSPPLPKLSDRPVCTECRIHRIWPYSMNDSYNQTRR